MVSFVLLVAISMTTSIVIMYLYNMFNENKYILVASTLILAASVVYISNKANEYEHVNEFKYDSTTGTFNGFVGGNYLNEYKE